MATSPLNIGILNVMHDKEATNQRFTHVLTMPDVPVSLTFFYPQTHYTGRPVPLEVQRILQPLDLEAVKTMDAFIITGAPIEKVAFDDVTYIDEVRQLLDTLVANDVQQLYVCWGGMVALNYFFGIEKKLLPQKLFGVYPQKILQPSELMDGLPDGFKAPHARYAEMDRTQILVHPALDLEATTLADELYLVESRDRQQVFLYSHLEYGRNGLLDEYRRETAAHPEIDYVKPANYLTDPAALTGPTFAWEKTQQTFYHQWLRRVSHHVDH